MYSKENQSRMGEDQEKPTKNNEGDGRKPRNISKFYAFLSKKRTYKYLRNSVSSTDQNEKAVQKRSVYLSTRWCTIAHLEKTQSWCRENFPSFWDKEIWPPSSPDLNPLDFSIWSMLKKTHASQKTFCHLKKSLQKPWADIPQKKIHVVVEAFRSRLE